MASYILVCILLAERWVWLGLIQAISTAPRGVLDPVVKGITELKFVDNEVSVLNAANQCC